MKIHEIAGFMACRYDFSSGACLESDRYFNTSIPFATEKPGRPHLQLKIKHVTVTARREVLPNYNGKIATIIIANRK